ncbi:MAG: LD-carboxypeptidase [Desulfobacterales bacterium]|nr:LD-carboxypeptidase [Desulfobacterales bacterium]
MKPLFPKRLCKGETIGIAAPAGAFNIEKFNQGIEILKNQGFNVVTPEGIFNQKSYFAGSDTERAKILNRLFADKSIKAIIAARGGFGSMKILNLINFNSIRKNKKIFIGFSDISAILGHIWKQSRLVCFHGPVVTNLNSIDALSIQSLIYAISSDNTIEIKTSLNHVIKKGTSEGIILGGNLSTICHLVGTPFQINFRNSIMFIEDINEPPYKIDRMLTQMNLAGCFNGIKGIMLGSFENCGDLNEIYKILDEQFMKKKIPILGGFDIGHSTRNLTIPLGIKAIIDTNNNSLIYKKCATEK